MCLVKVIKFACYGKLVTGNGRQRRMRITLLTIAAAPPGVIDLMYIPISPAFLAVDVFP